MAWYELTEKNETKTEYIQRVKYDNIICNLTKNFVDAVGNELLPNIQYRLVTELAFNAIVVIEYLIQITSRRMMELLKIVTDM